MALVESSLLVAGPGIRVSHTVSQSELSYDMQHACMHVCSYSVACPVASLKVSGGPPRAFHVYHQQPFAGYFQCVTSAMHTAAGLDQRLLGS